jgi:polysaccharide biosynthesis transport protein
LSTYLPSRLLLDAILRDWKRIAVITLVTTAIAWAIAAMQPTRYRASALVSVAPLADSLQPNELLRGVEVLERRTVVATVAALASTPVTRKAVGAAVEDSLEAAVLPNTNLIRVDVEGANADDAARVANHLHESLNAQTRTLYRYYGVTLVSPASRPDAPFAPRTGRAIAAGLLLGLFLGLVVAYFTTVRNPA